MSSYTNFRGRVIQNARFKLKLKRRPKAGTDNVFFYCPTFLTKHPDVDKNEKVQVVKTPTDKDDPSVEVCKYHGSRRETYNVFWEDLRK